MVGQRLSHYEILSRIGEGGMGVVYKARDTRLDRFAAIKILSGPATAFAEHRQRFTREAKAASALNHPGIITIYDIASDQDIDFIAMEYVPGKTLEQMIHGKALTLKTALDFAFQAAQALAKAHAVGLVHRDLKPSNIMVTDDGRVKIVDFGVAKLVSRGEGEDKVDTAAPTITRTVAAGDAALTADGRIVGTVAYMSPEQATGQKLDARSDIFSFGAVLYEMVTGVRAFAGESSIATLSAVINQEPKRPTDISARIPRELERIIVRCLRKDPGRRFQHMGDVAVELEEVRVESSTDVTAAAPRFVRSSRAAIGAGLLTILTAIAWGAWVALDRSERPAEMRHEQLTSLPGDEGSPTLSPDGTQVAFVWNGEHRENSDIYIKRLGVATPLRLTVDADDDRAPAWSPDGNHIAFVRRHGVQLAIYVAAPVPGSERKLATFTAPRLDLAEVFALPQLRITWSADSRWVLAPSTLEDGTSAIVAFPIGTDKPRTVLSLAPGTGVLQFPAVSPDGTALAFARRIPQQGSDLNIVRLDSALLATSEPIRVARYGGGRIFGIAWAADGGSLIYGLWSEGMHLWRIPREGGTPIRLELGGFALHPTVSAAGNKLAFVRSNTDVDLWKFENGAGPASVAPSTLNDMNPQFSPDGRRLAFMSDRGGRGTELWVSNADGSSAVRIVEATGRPMGAPQWSPGGSEIAYDTWNEDGKLSIYVVDADGGIARQVTSPANLPTWSRSGDWLYFGSSRSGRGQVWRIPVSGGEAIQITDRGGQMARESADGETLYYNRGDALYSRPARGGAEEKVIDSLMAYAFFPTKSGVYHVVRPDPQRPKSYEIRLLSFAPMRTQTLYRFDSLGSTFLLGVSPDEKTVLSDGISPSKNDDLMLIHGFR